VALSIKDKVKFIGYHGCDLRLGALTKYKCTLEIFSSASHQQKIGVHLLLNPAAPARGPSSAACMIMKPKESLDINY